MVCPYSFDVPGGVQVHAIDLCTEFQKRGHQVSLIGPAGKEVELPPFVVRGGAAIPIPYNGSVARLAFGPRTNARVVKWIENGNFDVVHIHEPNSPSYSMLTLRNAEGPIVATYHSAATKSRLLQLALPLLRPLLERIRGGIAVSEVARAWQVEQLGGDPILIPNGVQVKQFQKIGAEFRATRREVGNRAGDNRTADSRTPATKRRRLVFLGRFDEPRKGLPVLLAAIPAIRRQFPDIEIVVIGDGDRTAAARKAGEHADVLKFVGRVSEEEKARLLASADAYIAPQTGGESFGIVLVEAMASGCPVIASDLAAFRLVLDDGRYGMHFANGDSAELARTVVQLFSDAELQQRLHQQGLERSDEFDWPAIADRVLRVYETVAVPGEKVVRRKRR